MKEADKEIVKAVKGKGRLVDAGSLVHSYPFCWRSDTPLIYKVLLLPSAPHATPRGLCVPAIYFWFGHSLSRRSNTKLLNKALLLRPTWPT